MEIADGTAKPIDQTQPGDTVLATDPVTGQTEARRVTRAIRTDDDTHFVDVTVRDGKGTTNTVTTTEHHPFWSATLHRWVDAGTLRRGDLLRTSAGSYVQVGAVRRYAGHRSTYDLTVDGIHTYYVVAGGTPLLVHNCGVTMTQSQADALRPGGHSGPRDEPSAYDDGRTHQDERDWAQQQACHTCGASSPGQMIADHQDPTAFGPPGTPRDIYSQCRACSLDQSRGAAAGVRILINHGINPESEGAMGMLMDILDTEPGHIAS